METSLGQTSLALLRFLKDYATLRRKRVPAYGDGDSILWFNEIPPNRPEIRSTFFASSSGELPPDLWLEVRKGRMPTRPDVPETVRDWIRPDDLDRADQEPELLQEITILVETRAADPDAPPQLGGAPTEKVPEVRRLEDHPEVRDAWRQYLVNQWEPWAENRRRWEAVQSIYERVDFMRRRIEEAEERYELILGVGLLVWRDPTGTTVKRHLLTAPAEITLDAARGVLTVRPAASFEKFRIELDMLQLQDQPRLETAHLDDRFEELDVQAWDRETVGEILRVIANRASPDAQVDESSLEPLERGDETFRVIYAPALVLRERRPTAYEEFVSRLIADFEEEPLPTATAPWGRFLGRGEIVEHEAGSGVQDPENGLGLEDGRLYFPLPSNDEQRMIVDRLRLRPYVLVKGPPGTGKSHTIANLICHLLASGQRVLVTAQAPKALAVLRDLLPGDIRNLCVTTFGSTRGDQRVLEDSVRGILSRRNEWKGETWAREQIADLEQELLQLEDRAAEIERELRKIREAETRSHTLQGGYQGTAAQIARAVEARRGEYDWFPQLPDENCRCPLEPVDLHFIASVHAQLTEQWLGELRSEIGSEPLPDPKKFTAALVDIEKAERSFEIASKEIDREQVDALVLATDDDLDACEAFLRDLEEGAVRADRVIGDLAVRVMEDALLGECTSWDQLAENCEQLASSLEVSRERLGNTQVQISGQPTGRLLEDARRRAEHLRNGGRRGFWVLAPRVMRETRYVEERCRVDGEAPRRPEDLEALIAFLELKLGVEDFRRKWPNPIDLDSPDPTRHVTQVERCAGSLRALLKPFEGQAASALSVVPIGKRVDLARPGEREKWLALVRFEKARRAAERARSPLERWRDALGRIVSSGDAHPCLEQMLQAVKDRDVVKWEAAWKTREDLKRGKADFERYEHLLGQVDEALPDLGARIRSSQGQLEWKGRLLQLGEAWAWSAAQVWLREFTNAQPYERLAEERGQLQKKIEKKLEEMAALKAWRAFFGRLDRQTERSLTAWMKAIARIGKGTGKYAYKHRRTARQHLMECIPKIPAWIMPLYKVWESTDPAPGVFDTVVIDEASQAGLDALALLLLAKRVIVVGDDKQNSPEAVGVPEDDITRLARDHLRQFRFRDEFRPDTSLYDHTEREFGNPVSLREHFRCVPEIIRFSNDLCYTDAPLIPLRQPPPKRLPPLKAVFVEKGACEGEGQRIINRAEAEAIVTKIEECLHNDAYKGKTMGVIVLQGHAQAELIERKLAEVLEPKVREERKLRCGVPATFQGDERDVIFLSLVVAPNRNFRALTGLPDQRRFNVAMSRARDQVWLFYSVQPHDLSREDLRWRLLNFFYSPGQEALDRLHDELDRLEREAERLDRQLGQQPEPYESWFEVDVALELLRRGYRLRPQFEVAGYRIDLVIEGLANRLAVECDGEAWHGLERFDQDMARQRQLERAGWRFLRIRESEFYADREGAIRRIMAVCDELGIRAVGEEEQEATLESTASVSLPTAQALEEEWAYRLESDGDEEDNGVEESARWRSPAGRLSESDFPDPRHAAVDSVRATLRQIIQAEGPLTKGFLLKLYVEGCSAFRRAGKSVKGYLNRVLDRMLKEGEIVVEDELGDGSLESQVLRLAGAPKVRERPAGRRDLLEIPPSELLSVLDGIETSQPGIMQDKQAVARALLDHYGFSRLTSLRRRHIERILQHRQNAGRR